MVAAARWRSGTLSLDIRWEGWFNSGDASPSVLCPDVAFSIWERCGPVASCPEEGQRSDLRDGTPPLRGHAEREGTRET